MNGNSQKIVAGIIIVMLGWLVAEQRSFRAQVHRDFAEVRADIGDLRERMARLEGLFEGHVKGVRDE